MIRKSMFAGTWYPVEKSEIGKYFVPGLTRRAARAIISPHAGWQYSGKVAGELFSMIKPAATYVLVGPNHHGAGQDVGIYSSGAWETPLGELKVNNILAESILKQSKYARKDALSHSQEHSLEVLLPFIKYTSPTAEIVPISLRNYSIEACKDLGLSIAAAVKANNLSESTLLVASSDMSHFISAANAKKMDSHAIDKIEAFDPEGLLTTVEHYDISMCGSGPAAAILWAAQALGAANPELIRYANSGDVTGDYDQVVAYAGFLITAQ